MTFVDFWLLSRARFLVGVPQVTTFTWTSGLLGGQPIYKCGDTKSARAEPGAQRGLFFGPNVSSTAAHVRLAAAAARADRVGAARGRSRQRVRLRRP